MQSHGDTSLYTDVVTENILMLAIHGFLLRMGVQKNYFIARLFHNNGFLPGDR